MKRLGLDVGSTTIKCVVLDEDDKIIYSLYERHLSDISGKTQEILYRVAKDTGINEMQVSIAGSAGMGVAEFLDVTFSQEVYATRKSVLKFNPETDVVIELGGEDAKIIFITGGFETRMNGSCAGGTGAFIDQMATLLKITPDDLNEKAKTATELYTIASRCGVFAKSDIQPLLNQGADIHNICASILKAVVNQTIGGLAQGREIGGHVMYLGGPLTFLSELRHSFDDTLGLKGIKPENSLYYVALGAALLADKRGFDLNELAKSIDSFGNSGEYIGSDPLFRTEEDYNAFCERHKKNSAHIRYIDEPDGEMFLGIDAGSTTVKAIICNANGDILDSMYTSNHGNPVPIVRDYLLDVYSRYPDIKFGSSAVTGYGEVIIKNAFGADLGIVETMAHYTAAKKFMPDVDFIIDIGGQDIKCFKIRNGAIDNIFLNEACSSGCGSFLQTFAEALGYEIEEFSQFGLFAQKPVDLGSRCTVFMNSSVKQAQKDGATIEDISAGLSMSVVKNALYKVIRCGSASDLGKNIVVQGGTFMNDAVLRAFEMELKEDVVRPSIAGLMGAYGAALYAISHKKKECKLLDKAGLEAFTHNVRSVICQGCSNHCKLTVNTFGDKRTYIAGNRCEKPLNRKNVKTKYNMYEYKTELLNEYRKNEINPDKKTIGIPMGLNMYELLPFWHTFFTNLGYNVLVSPPSDRKLFIKGQQTVPSDTICFPAKLIHGHIEYLAEQKPDAIFYPCMHFNFDEDKGDNHFNCPVVAYYPEVIKSNVSSIKDITFIHDFVGPHNEKEFPKKMYELLGKYFELDFGLKQVRMAADKAYEEYRNYMQKLSDKAHEFMQIAKEEDRPVIVLVGRPYHLDPEVNHGLEQIMSDLGAIVVTEDGLSQNVPRFRTTVLNQWMYHSRLYLSAKYVADLPRDEKVYLIQFVSFGCGVDAVTTDETRRILEKAGKIYTQLKIDEVTNTGAARIRIRSLFAAAGLEG